MVVESKVDGLAAEESHEGDCTVDVVTDSLDQFSCLSFHNPWLLLVACIQRQCDELLGVARHHAILTSWCLQQTQAHTDQDVPVVAGYQLVELFFSYEVIQSVQWLHYDVLESLILYKQVDVWPSAYH